MVFKDETKIKRLHIGCGKRYIPGFIHIDVENYPHIDYNIDVSNLSIFGDNSIDLIYACHILEHFKKYEIKKVLTEWHRILRPCGILRIAVPDFESIISTYIKYKDIELIIGLLYGGQDNDYNFHHIAFDFKYLKKLLETIGFKNIHIYNWRCTIHKDYDDFSQAYIPHMDKEHGMLMSLNVECEK